MSRTPVVAVAGASGFIGSALCRELVADGMHVLALGRSAASTQQESLNTGTMASGPGITKRQADLFSLLQVERAIDGADIGIYLVHSMLPSARLTQGNFSDLDVLLADNFARAAQRKGLKRIVYVAGIIPDIEEGLLSKHLQSRLEVERVLGSTGVPVFVLRAGLVVGPGGSSLKIIINLVRRLPAMICPAWTKSKCQPIALTDLIALVKRVAQDPDLAPGAYDVGGPEQLSYRQMLEQAAAGLSVRRPMLPVPWFSTGLSALWVSTFSGTSMALVRPLVESLHCDMVAKDLRLNQRYGIAGQSFANAVKDAVHTKAAERKSSKPTAVKEVCSVQRIDIPQGKSVEWVAEAYASWLTGYLRPLVDAKVNSEGSISLSIRPLGIRRWTLTLLELKFSHERSFPNRSLFYITGGLLAKRQNGPVNAGRFEFRLVAGRNQVIAAVLDFRPSLPWPIYKITQAPVHAFIMARFARYLKQMAS